jgi:hypothetical protein
MGVFFLFFLEWVFGADFRWGRYDREAVKKTDDKNNAADGSDAGCTAAATVPATDQAVTPEVSSVIRLQNGMVLYLREINKCVSVSPLFSPPFRFIAGH